MTKEGLRRRLRNGGAFIRYLGVGVLTSLLDLVLFSALSVLLRTPEVPANFASTIITLTVSYFINRSFVFRSEEPPSLKGFFSFAGVTLFSGLIIQSAIIWGLVGTFAMIAPDRGPAVVNPVAKIVAMGVGAACNFLGYRFVFKTEQD